MQVRKIGGLFGEKIKFTPPQYANVFDFYSIVSMELYLHIRGTSNVISFFNFFFHF